MILGEALSFSAQALQANPIRPGDIARSLASIAASDRIARPDLEQRLVAVALADQVGAALGTQEPIRPHL